jgi:radical SAM protein with 4Fe4S-binding SPASM domain
MNYKKGPTDLVKILGKWLDIVNFYSIIQNMSDLKKDIFIIPHLDKYIIYSPLRRGVFLANNNAKVIIEKYITNQELMQEEKMTKVFDYIQKLEEANSVEIQTNQSINMSRLVIIPTQMCNLSCRYCYAKENRSTDTLEKEKLQTILNYFFDNHNKSINKKHFTFIGGGEPLLCWDFFTWAVKYIEDKAQEKNIRTIISLATNATLIDDKMAVFFRKNNIKVSVSFDIIPAIQNVQRAFTEKNGSLNSFELVDKIIKKYMSYEFFTRIRSTITDINVDLMPEMVSFVAKNYSSINRLFFEPATNGFEVGDYFYNKYIEQYFIAKKIAKENNIELTNSIEDSFYRIKNNFCPAEFCITPTGDIVSCHRASSSKDNKFNLFHYGIVNKDVSIFENDIDKTMKINNEKLKKCGDCFAKWHCAGGCPANRVLYTEKQQEDYCFFVKCLFENILFEKILEKEVKTK